MKWKWRNVWFLSLRFISSRVQSCSDICCQGKRHQGVIFKAEEWSKSDLQGRAEEGVIFQGRWSPRMTLNQKDCQGGKHRVGDYPTCPWEFYYRAAWKLDTQGDTCVQNRPLSQFTLSKGDKVNQFWDTSCCNLLSSSLIITQALFSKSTPSEKERESAL